MSGSDRAPAAAGGGPVLVINAGSSSLKYQVLVPGTGEVRAKGIVERIGETFEDGSKPVADHAAAIRVMGQQVAEAGIDLERAGIVAVGHRVVHGGSHFSDPTLIDDAVVAQIEDLVPLAPLHNPGAIAGIRAARERFANVSHVAVFDTAFFTSLPEAARTYAIPWELADKHRIRRYGFHGTSHQYVSGAAAEFLGRDLGALNQIVLHLGNGASMSAIRGGVAVDTSMGLTPLEGLVMGTRSGDVDPGLHMFFHYELGMTVGQIDTMLNKMSGLKGLAGDNDFRVLEARRAAGDADSQRAFDVYIHRLKHYIGAYLAVLGSVDVISFTAGVGENTPSVRAAALAGLEALGIEVDATRNDARSGDARLISTDSSRTCVLVVPTNEELAIARQALDLVG
jgi:acetate kinase